MKYNVFLLLTIAVMGSLQATTYMITNSTTKNIYGKIRPVQQNIQLFFESKKGPRVLIRSGETKRVEVEGDPCLIDIKMAYKPYRRFGSISKICGDATIILEGTYPQYTATIQMP